MTRLSSITVVVVWSLNICMMAYVHCPTVSRTFIYACIPPFRKPNMSAAIDRVEEDYEFLASQRQRMLAEVAELSLMKKRLTGGSSSMHVATMDAVVIVNSFFAIALFLGISLTAPHQITSINSGCKAGSETQKYLVVFEVVSFSCFLFSTLVVHGMKLFMFFLNFKGLQGCDGTGDKVKFLRFGMFCCAIGSAAGTIFLVLSMVNIIQLKLGPLHCGNGKHWADIACSPMISLVGVGVTVFLSSVLYAFLH